MSVWNRIFGETKTLDGLKVLELVAYKKAIQKGTIQLVDVRTALEYNSGHISNANNLDYFQRKQFLNGLEALDKNKAVYLYCRSGARSKKAAQLMLKQGFTEIYDLKGGYLGWS